MPRRRLKLSFDEWWLITYVAGAVLFPPWHIGPKFFYASEWLLIPLLGALLTKAVRREASLPARTLRLLLLATTVAFIAGLFRGDLALQLTLYPTLGETDRFRLAHDVVPFARWLIIFATPWIVRNTLQHRRAYVALFLETFKYAAALSAVMTFLNHWGLISLVNLGYYEFSPTWKTREFGTFPSPLEGSLVYAGAILAVLCTWKAAKKRKDKIRSALAGVLCAGSLALTHGGTAVLFLMIVLGFFVAGETRKGAKRYFFAAALAVLAVFMLAMIPRDLLMLKFNDLTVRSVTWSRWLAMIPNRPWILLVGIGFSGLIVDNSIILFLIKGGLFLLVSFGMWMRKLYSCLPVSQRYLFYFWALSWLTLDSWGFWGLGRLMWMLLALNYSASFSTALEERTRSSPPRGSAL